MQFIYRNKLINRVLSCFILDKSKRRQFRAKYESLKNMNRIYYKYKIIYQAKIEHLKQAIKTRKLKVVFLCSETSKWNLQYLYNIMLKSNNFEPTLVLTARPKYYTKDNFKHNAEFFKARCENFEIGFNEKNQTGVDLKIFKPDIVFFQQPWDLLEKQDIDYVSNFALTCYSPYPISEAPDALAVNLQKFHFKLWKHFIFNEGVRKQYEKLFGYGKQNIVVVGHPKIDVYNENKEQIFQKPCVIYAPHHALNFSWIKYSTFDWNGIFMLEWAKKHPEINWVFKPHPDLKRAVWFNEKLMSKQEIENYYNEWAKIGLYYNDGDYFNLFKNSKCLITDCGSFLTEYLPTGNPVIHLRSKKATAYTDINCKIMPHYYQAWDLKQLEKHLNNIVLNNFDPMKNERLKLIKMLGLDKTNASEKVLLEIKNALL